MTAKRYLDTKEHKEWSKKIRELGCAIGHNCSTKLDAHHLIPKNIEKFRSDPMNGICLCARHHSKYGYGLSPHSHGYILFTLWMIKNRPVQLKWVTEMWDSL